MKQSPLYIAIVQIRLEDKTDTIQNPVNAIKV